jgi:dimethylglycine dehydrogenase
MYVTPMPHETVEVGRPMKTSGVYQTLKEKGAEFFDLYGWEKPAWFNRDKITEQLSYKRNNIFPIIQKECENVHNNVGVIDLSTFSKFEITGEDSFNFLNRVCVNRIPEKNGSIVLTHILNDIGRIQTELTVTKIRDNHYYALSGASSEIRDLDWFNHQKIKDENVNIKNLTLAKGVLGLIGPKSRILLQKLTDTDLSNDHFKWLTSKEIKIKNIEVLAMRVNYVGELGWELHCSMDKINDLYNHIWQSGIDENIVNFGSHAMNSMRMEKAYRGWGTELTPEISVVEAGLDRFFNLENKDKFIGSEAIQKKIKEGIKTKLVYLEVEAKDADVLGNEPVLCDDKIIGLTTSGAYGFRVKKSLAFAYIEASFNEIGKELSINIQGEKIKTKIIQEPAFDSNNERLKS